MKYPFFKKADIIPALIIIAAAVMSLAALRCSFGTGAAAVVISVDGEVTDSLPLDTDQSVVIETVYGKNKVCVEGGWAYMEDADCPGHDCMQLGKIRRTGEIIVCLPNHLIVRIVGSDQDVPDAVVR